MNYITTKNYYLPLTIKKSEIPNPKFETNLNDQNSNYQNRFGH